MGNPRGRPTQITPFLWKGRHKYSANIFDATGNRVFRSLHTDDELEAELICNALMLLHQTQPASISTAPEHLPRKALELFWPDGDSPKISKPVKAVGQDLSLIEKQPDRIADLSPEMFAQITSLLAENRSLRYEKAHLQANLERVQRELYALKASALTNITSAFSSCPSLTIALDEFEHHMVTTTPRHNAGTVVRVARAFVAELPAAVKTPPQITANHIEGWLDQESARSDRPISRRDKVRIRLGRFINWAAKRWTYQSPMKDFPAARKQQLRRDRGEIDWHTLEEVEAAIEGLPDTYWKALVGTLAYAGLQLEELIWLRTQDLELGDEGGQLWITAVVDPSGDKHPLKAGHRRRAVALHQQLVPLLRKHIENTGTSGFFLFPIPPEVTRKHRKLEESHPDRWLRRSLSSHLLGSKASKNKKAKQGLLPRGMTPSGFAPRESGPDPSTRPTIQAA